MKDDPIRNNAKARLKAQYGWAKDANIGANWLSPDWSVIRDAAVSAPPFPSALFGNAADYIRSAAKGAGAPVDYVAAMLIAAVGATLCKKCRVHISDDWIVPLVIWCAIVGPPSSGKTPATKPIRRALYAMQARWAEAHKDRIEAEIAEAEARGACIEEVMQLRDQLKAAPRLLVNDSTAEALARVELRAPDGLLVERDELAGLIENLERYGAGGDRAYYLEAYDTGPFTIDRVKAGTLHIENHCFSVFGGIQPERFRALLTHSGDDDGFAARQLIFWPEPIAPTSIPQGTDHGQMIAALDRLDSIRSMAVNSIVEFSLSRNAFSALEQWYVGPFGERYGTTGKLGSAYGKLSGMVARIAGCLHLLDWAFDEKCPEELPMRIDQDTVGRAIDLVESYFVPQLQRAYHGTDLPNEERIASGILDHCKRSGLKAFNARQARREWGIAGSSRKGASQDFDAATTFLEETGWAKPLQRKGGAKDFDVNPALFGDDHDDAI